jgi:hypothetical protein
MNMVKKGSVLLLFAFLSFQAQAQDEYQAKAFFLYNFTRLIEWPANSKGEFVIGVVGNSPIYNNLTAIAQGKKVGNQSIVIKQFKSPEEITSCNILFVANGAINKLEDVKARVSNHHTLIVGDREGSTDKGAAINFVLNNNKLSFSINVGNAQKYGLKVSRSLIEMAS